jgi:hypothetical protein
LSSFNINFFLGHWVLLSCFPLWGEHHRNIHGLLRQIQSSDRNYFQTI